MFSVQGTFYYSSLTQIMNRFFILSDPSEKLILVKYINEEYANGASDQCTVDNIKYKIKLVSDS